MSETGSGQPPYRIASIDGLDRVSIEEGMWRPVRRALGVTAFGVNAYSAEEAGQPLIEEHDERSPGAGGHEELYVVLHGAAEFHVGGDRLDTPAGTLLLVEPGTLRSATSTEPGTTVLVIGGQPGAALPPSPFEYWYAAIPAHEAGEHEQALATVAEGLEHYPEHGTIHYAIACELALLGRRDEAIGHLRTAFANDPRTRAWAAEDRDLDTLRDDPLLAEA